MIEGNIDLSAATMAKKGSLKELNVSVSGREGVVTVKREGTRRAVVANVLGRVERDGVELLCLDRLVHEPHQHAFIGWNVAGAVTTMPSRAIDAAPA